MTSVKLSPVEIAEIQKRYHFLTNYASDDPSAPIDPLTYSDSNGDHLLHIAAQNGDLRTIKLLLTAGLDIDQLGDMGCTALHYAKLNGHEDIASFLLARGASTGIRNAFGCLPGEQK